MTLLEAMLADAKAIKKRHIKEYGQPLSRSRVSLEEAKAIGSKSGLRNCYRGGRSKYSPVRDKVQGCLTDEWQTTREIYEAADVTYERAKSCLQALKSYGLAEHQIPDKLAMWRLASEQPK